MAQHLPFKGVKVLSFESAFALPACTRALADLGADVVRVASPARRPGRSALDMFLDDQDILINKRTIVLNLSHRDGLAIGKRLAAMADVVCNNFRNHVMKRFGLDRAGLVSINPDVISLQLTGYGEPGPWSSFPAYGPAVEAAGGMNAMIGDDSYPPMRVGSDIYADQAAARYALLALSAALEARHRTGRGQHIDLSMYEAVVHLLGESLVRAASHEQAVRRIGNRDGRLAPQGIYPCAGIDEWVAISVESDAQWAVLIELLDDEDLRHCDLNTMEARQVQHDFIDQAICRWTCDRDKTTVAELLQSRGIPAGPVARPADVLRDPQHLFRGFFQPVHHRSEVLGQERHPHMALGWRHDGLRRSYLRDPHPDGADSVQVLNQWLGLGSEAIGELISDGAVSDVSIRSIGNEQVENEQVDQKAGSLRRPGSQVIDGPISGEFA